MIKILKAGLFESAEKFKNREITPERKVKCHEVELFVGGEGKSFVDGVAYPHEKGNLLFAKPGQMRHSEKKFSCFYIHISVGSGEKELLESILPCFKVTNYPLIKSCYVEIIRLYQNGNKDSELLLQSKIYELLDIILKESKLKSGIKKVGERVSPETLQNAINFIDKNFDKNIVLKDVADAVNFSPVYFHKMFTSSLGITPHQYILNKRLESAKTYLLTTSYSMNDIVEKCGFSSVSYFASTFKKNVGITPSEFRQKKYII